MSAPFLLGGVKGVGGVLGARAHLSVSVVETLAAQSGLSGSLPERLNQSVAFSGNLGSVWDAVLQATASLSSPAVGFRGFYMTADETVQASELSASQLFAGQPLILSVSLADALATSLAFAEAFSETFAASESLAAPLFVRLAAACALSETPGGTLPLTVADIATLSTLLGAPLPLSLADVLTVNDASEGHRGYFRESSEGFSLTPTVSRERWALTALTDTLTVSPALASQLVKRVVEQLSFSDSAVEILITRILEAVNLTSVFATSATQHTSLSEWFTLGDVLKVIFELLAAETVNLSGSEALLAKRFEALTDALAKTDRTITTLTAQQIIAASILLNDEALRYFEGTLSDGVSALEALTSSLVGLNALTETAALSATSAASLSVIGLISDRLGAGEGLANIIKANATLKESFNLLTLNLKINGEEYIGWALNTESTGVTQYEQYPFNSLAKFGERYLGAGAMGICELSGSTDAGQHIQARLKTGVSDFGSPMKKRIDRAYLGITADGGIILKTITNKGIEDWYQLTPRDGDVHTERVKLGKGVKSRYWQFELSNSDGADFELESLELEPIILSRRL